MFNASYQKYTLIFKKPAGTSRGALHLKDTFFLRLSSADEPARFGLGECGPLPGLSLDGRADFENKVAEVCRLVNEGGAPLDLDLADFPALAFGLETAWLDWQTGGKRRLFETDFSRGLAGLPTHGLIWMADRTGLLQQIHHKVAQGFTCIKMKIGALDFEEECALLAEVRRVYPPSNIELRLDANGAFTPENVMDRLQRLAQFHVAAIEQPLKPDQHAALAEVCAHSPIAVALDETLIGIKTRAERKALLEAIKPHHIVLKPSLIGGFAAAETWIEIAQTLGIGWWINSMLESNIGLNAICQWVSSLQPTVIQGLGTGQLFKNNISAPLRLEGANLVYDQALPWNLTRINV